MANNDLPPEANEDYPLPDDLPPVPEAAKPKRKYTLGAKKVNLDNWEANELAKAMEPHVRRVPNEEGNLPARPSEGVSELVDPDMSVEKLAQLLAPDLPFTFTANNIYGAMGIFYGKPRRPKRVAWNKGKSSKSALINERIVFLENKLSDMLMVVSNANALIAKLTSQITGQQEVLNTVTKNMTNLMAMVDRLDKEKVNKAGSPMLEAARRNTLERPVETTHDLSKLGEIVARRKRFGLGPDKE